MLRVWNRQRCSHVSTRVLVVTWPGERGMSEEGGGDAAFQPQPGVGVPPKAKSRWCVHGHTDESVLAFLQVLINCGMPMQIAVFKNAFFQGNPLRRSRRPLFVKPCLGLTLGQEILAQLVAPVYGLDDVAVEWHRIIFRLIADQLGPPTSSPGRGRPSPRSSCSASGR